MALASALPRPSARVINFWNAATGWLRKLSRSCSFGMPSGSFCVQFAAGPDSAVPKPIKAPNSVTTAVGAVREILKNAEWILPFGTGVSYCLPPRQARPFHGEIRPSDLSFPWPFQHRGRLFLLSARSGEQSLFDNYQIGQRKQGM